MKQAMIFAAGLGTRLKPLTDSMPKALVKVGGKPLLWHVLHRLSDAGVERVVVNVHHFAEQIVDYLNANNLFGMDIHVSDERQKLLETGGGIKKALPLFDPHSPVLIHNVDILSNADLKGLFESADASGADALLLVSNRKTKRYLLFDDEMPQERSAAPMRRLRGWTNTETGEVKSPYEELEPSAMKPLAFSGVHLMSPTALSLLEGMPERFGIIEFYLKVCQKHTILGIEQKDLQLLDVGKQDTLAQAEQFVITHLSSHF